MSTRPRSPGGVSPFQEFFATEAAGGAVLVACAVVALLLANGPWSHGFHDLWMTPMAISLGRHGLTLTLHQWINDGLMAMFFLLVGLEIKREVLAGELASIRQAALPVAGALGGMVAPALIYVLLSGGGEAVHGWAIPMATDIAFALGVLALVAPNAPSGLKVFLAALAIVDDMGAVLVIALFYTSTIVWSSLALAGGVLALLVALNALKVRHLAPYLLLGLPFWYFVHASGIHATVAGVLLAFCIPTRTRINAAEYSARARDLLDDFDRTETGDLLVLTSKGQQEAIIGLERASEGVTAPLLRLEHALQAFSGFVVMPLFALSNAGVEVQGLSSSRLALAVAMGLVVGKPLGITVASLVAVRAKLATLPEGVTWAALHGCAWLGGIGFTMSLFIATLAFGPPLVDAAKVGILGGSVVAGAIGALLVRRSAAVSGRQS